METSLIIRRPIEEELVTFKNIFNASLQTSNPLLKEVLEYIRRRQGKMMRPILTILVAKQFAQISQTTYYTAVTLEMLHTASLVHDDVVDESDERRGQPSVNSIFNNKVSVLVGDYLLSTALYHASLTHRPDIVEHIALLGQQLSEGELLQLSNINEVILSEDVYFDIIGKKTAAFFAACAQLGALSAGASAEEVEHFRLFGEKLGICFQLRDDIFDYYDSSEVGKPMGNDMLEGKLTLPALYAIVHHGNAHTATLVEKVKKGSATTADITELMSFAKQYGGIEYTKQVMDAYRNEALSLLDGVADSEIRTALTAYLNYVVDRKN